MKISRTVSYAIQAAVQLAQSADKSPTPCSKLAARGGMPERFLLQILRNLVNHGVLESTRGVEGGYRLVRDPRSITLLEIIEAIEGPLKPSLAPLRGLNQRVQQILMETLERATERFRAELTAITLADLVAQAAESGGSSQSPAADDSAGASTLPSASAPPSGEAS